jgi:uroporphyrinogen decarboxylase
MDCIDRIYAAIRHEKTDKVPKGELGIAKELTKQILGVDKIGLDQQIEIRRRLNMDLINWWGAVTPKTIIGKDERGSVISKDEWGNVWRETGSTSDIIEPAIKRFQDISCLKYPSLDYYKERIDHIKYFINNSSLFVFVQLEGVFTPMTWMCGFNNFMIYTCTYSKTIKKLAMDFAEYYAQLAKVFIDIGVHGIMIGDDLAFNTGTFMSPQSMRELIFPALKREVESIKSYKDVPVFLHTDGNINKVIDDVVDCGFDGLQSLQPSANMDLNAIKEKYGDKLCLMGNIDINNLLPFGTEQQVRMKVRETIETGSKGGGFILSTCNILTKDIPLQNAVAMYDEAERV